MYPLTLIKLSKNKEINIALKNGQNIVGRLIHCDIAMNMHLRSVTLENVDKSRIHLGECYLRGQIISYIQIDSKLLSMQHKFDKPRHKINDFFSGLKLQ